MPRLKRMLASLGRFNAFIVRRTLTKSKFADSSRMFFVDSLTSVSRPPMTPARAIGPDASAMTRCSGVSFPSGVMRQYCVPHGQRVS